MLDSSFSATRYSGGESSFEVAGLVLYLDRRLTDPTVV